MIAYPKISNVKKANIAMRIMIIISILISSICIIINLSTSTKHMWSLLVIAGIIYTWITVIYSIHRNINIASSVMIQTIAVSALTIAIDFIIGYKGWAINLSIPIIIIVANFTILMLTFVSVNKYYKYAIYQIIIFIISMIPLLILIFKGEIIKNPIYTIISSFVALLNLIFCIALCGKSIKEQLVRILHM